MKYPNGTSREEWTKYREDLKAFEQRMELVKPKKEDYKDEQLYNKAMQEWYMSIHVDAPNRPGYDFANND